MKHRILFVCMGNICRSPTAEGVFRTVAGKKAPELELEIDSAGTHSYHVGHPPDDRARAAALRRGIDLSGIRARQVEPSDFTRFEYILAMDESNLSILRGMHEKGRTEQVRLFLDFAGKGSEREVPDPYYGGENGFEHVLDLIEDASEGLLAYLVERR